MRASRDSLIRLRAMRERFLDEDRGETALADYWRSAADLAAYDAVLAARIGWKWDAALAEAQDRGLPRADEALVVDYGCGTGIAARRFVHHFGARAVQLHDRSKAAMLFAVDAVRGAFPQRPVQMLPDVATVQPDVLLVSHVLGELDAAGDAALRALIARSRSVVIVEPGSKVVARRLSTLRDSLLGTFQVLAPCPHAGRCGALANARDWCHFFAPPPPEVFTDGDWVRTARELGIDLRALPYSFLVLTRDAVPGTSPTHRLLGRPQVLPHVVRTQCCKADGLATVEVGKRHHPQFWRAAKKHPETLRTLPDSPDAPDSPEAPA